MTDAAFLSPASPACHSHSAPRVSCPDTFNERDAASQRSKTSSPHHHTGAWGCRVLRANDLQETAFSEELDDMDNSISSDDDDGDKIAAVYWMLHHAKNFISTFSLSVVVVQSLNHIWLFATPPIATRQASLSFTISQSLLKLMFFKSVMPSNHLILCHPLLFLSSIFPSIRVFSNESALHIRWPKYWSFSFSISPFNEYSGLISFTIDWVDLLAVQGTQESSPAPQIESINSLFFFFTFFLNHFFFIFF